MKAYAILDGGGVKGAALAGCLKAAEEEDIRFEGYGGTSAGSIVALLACIGYDGDELRDIMAEEGELTRFLNEDVSELELAQRIPVNLPPTWWSLPGYLRYRGLFSKLIQDFGLYGGELLKRFLSEKIKKQLRHCPRPTHVSFTGLSSAFEEQMNGKCPLLKIVVSDIGQRKAIVYSGCGAPELDGSVIDAVRASTSFPFVFRPVRIDDRYYVDGGLSSNLPVFLFERERRTNRLPVLAFDLVSQSEDENRNDSLGRFCSDMIATALESSDSLLRDVMKGIHHIEVPVPREIDTFSNLNKEQRLRLFDIGYEWVCPVSTDSLPLGHSTSSQSNLFVL
jgi:NTE family protein